ncbi:MAG: molecular chaperone TorD family protein [Deltaproteobacteria bacterium]|nr:molecular chaperone TorD family protein [Deltaproteobacteria bacterium]
MMETETPANDQEVSAVDLALCRATLYSALALGFRPPTEETIARLTSEKNVEALAEAAAILDPNGEENLASAARGPGAVKPLSAGELSESFQRFFGHTAQGAAPPYETEYGTEGLFQQPQEMGDLMGFYQAFGLKLKTEVHERADHVSCECEFLCFLALKEAYALEHGDAPMLEETRKATRLFLRDHLGHFVPAFTKRMAREDRGGFYGALANLCYRLVTQDCALFGVPLGPQSLSLRPATDDRVPMACGSGAECVAMPGACSPEDLE